MEYPLYSGKLEKKLYREKITNKPIAKKMKCLILHCIQAGLLFNEFIKIKKFSW